MKSNSKVNSRQCGCENSIAIEIEKCFDARYLAKKDTSVILGKDQDRRLPCGLRMRTVHDDYDKGPRM